MANAFNFSPDHWYLLAAIRAATDADSTFPDLPEGDPRSQMIDDLQGVNLIDAAVPEIGGWIALVPE